MTNENTQETEGKAAVDLPRLRQLQSENALLSESQTFLRQVIAALAEQAGGELRVNKRVTDLISKDAEIITQTDPVNRTLVIHVRKSKLPNDPAQQRATNDEPNTEDATGALAAAPCSATCGRDHDDGATHLIDPYGEEPDSLPAESFCRQYYNLAATDAGPPTCPQCAKYWGWFSSLNDTAQQPET